ncbi:hypothetical protein BC827DRAFT_1081417, partial [Russula dissimulans]
ARRCKGKGGVHHYQDSQDRAATSNLKTHAVRCFGTDAVDAAFKKGPSTTPGTSIFGAFAQLGHQPVSFSHCTHTIDETRVFYQGYANLDTMTVSRDIKIVFEWCHERINKILKEHPGRIHFATDAWTSSNHRVFVAWTVHLHHHGHLLTFVLDI